MMKYINLKKLSAVFILGFFLYISLGIHVIHLRHHSAPDQSCHSDDSVFKTELSSGAVFLELEKKQLECPVCQFLNKNQIINQNQNPIYSNKNSACNDCQKKSFILNRQIYSLNARSPPQLFPC